MSQLGIPGKFHRSQYDDAADVENSARFLISHVCEAIGLDDLSDTELLDVGCGTKCTEALLNDDIPIKRYVGVDVYGEMIEFLRSEVKDPRFEYFHLDVRNELYNPDAPPMSSETDLGVGARSFDLIWLFSVFTHLNPDDFRTMLQILRRYIRPGGSLFFTAFLNERTASGFGATETLARGVEEALANNPDLAPDVVERLSKAAEEEPADFLDMVPEQPLLVAMYSRRYAHELIEGTGWRVQTVLEPNAYAQHQFVCVPAE